MNLKLLNFTKVLYFVLIKFIILTPKYIKIRTKTKNKVI